MMDKKTTNVFLYGVGGQGIILASDILAETAFIEGLEIKKSEIRGLSLRGGSVSSSVRWGHKVYSPIIPVGLFNFMVILRGADSTIYPNRENVNTHVIKGTDKEYDELPHLKCANIYMLGKLSCHIDFKEENFIKTITENICSHYLQINLKAFNMGQAEEKRQLEWKRAHSHFHG
jgi:indolepyruvate ferredoxin oxidoreductase beta subunit